MESRTPCLLSTGTSTHPGLLHLHQMEQHRSEVSLKSEGDTLQGEDQLYARHTVGANQFQPLDGQRVLGLHWDSGSDQFIFDVSQVGIDANLEPTKKCC